MHLVLICIDCGEAYGRIGEAADHERNCAVEDNTVGKYQIETTGD